MPCKLVKKIPRKIQERGEAKTMQAVTRALNTTAHEETRNFRKLNEERSRSREEDSAEIGTRLARLQVITATTIMPRTATRLMIATQVKKMHAKRVTAIRLLAEEDESVAEMTERTATVDASLPQLH